MRLDEQLQEQIEKYVSGKLTPPDAAQFEEEMSQNEALQKEVQLQREVHLLINLYGKQQAARGKITQIAAEVATEEGTKTISLFQKMRPLMAIAAVLVLAVAAYFIFANQTDPLRLYANNFTPYANTLTVRGETDTSAIARAEVAAMQHYQNQEYPQAAATFEQLTQLNPKDHNTYNFYAGIALLANMQAAEALPKLQAVAQNNNPYKEQAEWYIALAYLQIKDKAKAKELLTQIAAQSVHDRKMEAQKLLKSL